MIPLVSIALATYNGDRFLEEQLISLYGQTYKNVEVVVSDDISEDNTIEILKKYQKLFGLRYSINSVRLGVTKNFEKAIVGCKGKYILLSDQDDIWLPEKIDRLMSNIGSASLIYSDLLIYDVASGLKQGRMSNQKWIRPFGIDSSNAEFLNYAVLNSFILGCSVMFKKEILIKAIPFYESELNHDWWLILCAHTQNGVKYLDEILLQYRIHENNFSMLKAKGSKSNFKKLKTFFWFETVQERQERKVMIGYVLSRFKNHFDPKIYLELSAYSKVKKYIFNFSGFWYVLKYQKYFFPTFSFLRRFFAVLTSILK